MTEGSVFESCIYDDDGERPEFAHTTRPRARKEYHCCECSRNIKPGEVYERVAGKWDGEVSTVRTCIVCTNVRVSLFKGAFTYGNMWEAIREEFREYGEFKDTTDEDWLIGPPLADRQANGGG